MINFGGPQKLNRCDSLASGQQFRSAWVSGLQTSCLEVESDTPAQLIVASLRPVHAGPLLGVSGRELAGRVVSLDEVIARKADELATWLRESPSVVGRFLLFEDLLRERLRRSRRPPHPAVCRAVRALIATAGQSPVRRLRGQFGCSPRYLESRVSEETGLTPKQLARLLRFSRAVDEIRTRPAVDWRLIAHACGYYDQPHFNHDFRLFTGVTPTEFLASRDPSTQAMLVD